MMGNQYPVTIDDRLPMNREPKKNGRVLLSRPSPAGAWWLPILEKAYAKWNVNYANLSGGWMSEALHNLTNMPAGQVRTAGMSADAIWAFLSHADKEKWVITTACFKKRNGLVAGHAYTVIGVATVEDANGKKHRLVKARNPWGAEGYNGDWSDKSKLWTPALREQVGSKVANDGVFWLPVE